ELAEREIAAFREDAHRLGCRPPTHEPRATEHVPLMIALVERLVANGLAYPVPDGSVYFRVRRFPEYGKLSHRRLDDMEVGADKMSKSLGNVLNVAAATEQFPGEALRLLYFGTHSRAPLDFGPGRLEEAARSLERLYESLARADETVGAPPAVDVAGALAGELSPFLAAFAEAMDEDLNAAKALGL